MAAANKNKIRERRRARIRAKIRGTAEVPRLSLYTSNKRQYAQVVNDDAGVTLASSSDRKVSGEKKMSKRESAAAIGRDIAAQVGKGKRVVFDRGNKKYTGNVKILADAAREGGAHLLRIKDTNIQMSTNTTNNYE
ncbi:MAG: 50S ribosomal protein L18 [Parcubacteria group bacterium]|nr:50S ribosomal protein L18 [Parcubacteria group bacterium]MBI3074770.1 50S ribosomal protein L18 [Parcubacteria group bacterium]